MVMLPLLAIAAGNAGASEPAPAPAASVAAPPEALGWTLYAGYESHYLYRGINYGKHLCEVGLIAPVKLSDDWTFTFAPWYGELAGGDYPELDLVGSLGWNTGHGTLSLNLAWYDLPGRSWSTLEPGLCYEAKLGTIAGAPLVWTASVGLDVYADGGSSRPRRFGAPGWYLETGLAATWSVTRHLSLTPELQCSYGARFYGVDGWNSLGLKLTAKYSLTSRAYLTPFIAASFAMDGLRRTGETSHLAGGVMMNVDF